MQLEMVHIRPIKAKFSVDDGKKFDKHIYKLLKKNCIVCTVKKTFTLRDVAYNSRKVGDRK